MPKQFYNHLFDFLNDKQIDYELDSNIIRFKEYSFSLFLVIETDTNTIDDFIKYRQQEKSNYEYYLIFVWFDIWNSKKDIVLSKITHLLGLSIKIHARKTKVVTVNKETCNQFFNANHLNKPVIGYKRIGLELNGELIALGSFAKRRKFRDDTYSAELLQFSTKNGHHINGGLSKIIKGFTANHKIDSLMTYIDLDWSTGHKFTKIGFDIKEIKGSNYFNLSNLNKNREISNHKTTIFNTGSLKSLLQL